MPGKTKNAFSDEIVAALPCSLMKKQKGNSLRKWVELPEFSTLFLYDCFSSRRRLICPRVQIFQRGHGGSHQENTQSDGPWPQRDIQGDQQQRTQGQASRDIKQEPQNQKCPGKSFRVPGKNSFPTGYSGAGADGSARFFNSRSIMNKPGPVSPIMASFFRILSTEASSSTCSAMYHCITLLVA